jgi:hypothetical protein
MPQQVIDEAEEVRELIAENPAIGSPQLFVDENTSGSGNAIPGFAAGYFAAEDQAGINMANRSCWHSCTANLSGLLNNDGNPNPNYWTMVDYAAMTGTRVSSQVSDLNLSSLAVTDTSGATRVLLGRHQTCSEPTTGAGYCSGPSTLPAAIPTTVQVVESTSAAAATVTIQEIPNSLADTTTAPAATTQTVPIVNGLASVSIPSFGDGEAYFLTVTPIPPPSITSIAPAAGTPAGGTSVTINGSGFTGATAVQFGSGVPATKFTVTSANQVVATAPAHPAGPVDITVTTPRGTSSITSLDTFTYRAGQPTLMSISPTTGTTSGGTTITIIGTGFTGATAVQFGTGSPAAAFTVVSDTQILATAPSHAAGAVKVSVTTPDGTSAVGTLGGAAPDTFTYLAPPTITSISPHRGRADAGTAVTIKGTGFAEATSVHFGTGSPAAAFTVVSDTQIHATAPPHAAGPVGISVTTPEGTSAIGSPSEFSYISPPTITSISPRRGTPGGGTSVTITGRHFTSATTVHFGTAAAPRLKVDSPTRITVKSPRHSRGVVDIHVTAAGQTSAARRADRFTYTRPRRHRPRYSARARWTGSERHQSWST